MLGLWEDAAETNRRQLESQRQMEVFRRQAVDEQQQAIKEFIQAMTRLRIAPQNHYFVREWRSQFPRSRHGVAGWRLDWSPDTVLTPDGAIFQLSMQKATFGKPLDVASPISWSDREGLVTTLVDVLRRTLTSRMRDL